MKKITTDGTFRCRSRLLYLANAMVHQPIGLKETDDGFELRFKPSVADDGLNEMRTDLLSDLPEHAFS